MIAKLFVDFVREINLDCAITLIRKVSKVFKIFVVFKKLVSKYIPFITYPKEFC